MKADDLQYDLGNLSAFDNHPIDLETYKSNETYLIEHVQSSVQFMFNKLFALAQTEEEDGLYVELPIPSTLLPRQKSVPVPKPPTRWELMQKRKGIKNSEKDKLVYSEEHDEFRTRYGYKSKNDKPEDWVIEAKERNPNHDPSIDPFLAQKMSKKKKHEIEKLNRIGNMAKNAQAEGKFLPSDLTEKLKKRSKKRLLDSFDIAKLSTASIGKFDGKMKGEPKRSEIRTRNKQQFSKNEFDKSEHKDQESILNRVLRVQEEKQNKLTNRAVSVFQQNTEKKIGKGKKMALLAQNKSRWYNKSKPEKKDK